MAEKAYIGTKVIAAEPMSRHEWMRAVTGETPIVGEDDRPGYKVRYEDGYVSWSPKEVFERCYREITDQEKALIGG